MKTNATTPADAPLTFRGARLHDARLTGDWLEGFQIVEHGKDERSLVLLPRGTELREMQRGLSRVVSQ